MTVLTLLGCKIGKDRQKTYGFQNVYLTLNKHNSTFLLQQDNHLGQFYWSFGSFTTSRDSIVLNSYHLKLFDSIKVVVTEEFDKSINGFRLVMDSTTDYFSQILVNNENINEYIETVSRDDRTIKINPEFYEQLEAIYIDHRFLFATQKEVFIRIPESSKFEPIVFTMKTKKLINPQSEVGVIHTYQYQLKDTLTNTLIVSIQECPPYYYFPIAQKYPYKKKGIGFTHQTLTNGMEIWLNRIK